MNDTPNIRLLVVDDDEGIRMLLEVSISLDARFTLVGTAVSGNDAITFLQQVDAPEDRPDVVLLDVSLPDGGGIELLPRVRETCPGVRVALFTGWSDDETIDRAKSAGADAVFGKERDLLRLLDDLAELSRT